jgi:hypothetical protein
MKNIKSFIIYYGLEAWRLLYFIIFKNKEWKILLFQIILLIIFNKVYLYIYALIINIKIETPLTALTVG